MNNSDNCETRDISSLPLIVAAAALVAAYGAEAQTPGPAAAAAPAATAPAPAAGPSADELVKSMRALLGPDDLDCDGKPCPPKVELPPCDPTKCKCPDKDCEKPKPPPRPKPKPKPVPPPPPPDILPLRGQDFCPPHFRNRTVTPPQYASQTAEKPGYANTPRDPMPGKVKFALTRVSNSTKTIGHASFAYEEPYGSCTWQTERVEPVTDEFAPAAPVMWTYNRFDPPVRTTAAKVPSQLCGEARYELDEQGRVSEFDLEMGNYEGIPGAPDGMTVRIYPRDAVLITGTKGWGADQRPVVYGGRPNQLAWRPGETKVVCVPKI